MEQVVIQDNYIRGKDMKMQLKIFNQKDELITNIKTGKKRRILHFIQADTTPKARYFIRVYYSKGFTNCGEYHLKKDLLLALHAFTEN
jgi:hypothetical protein